MSKVTQPEPCWEVLAQPSGEVLAVEARSPGLHLGLLGVPPGFDARDAEGWLYDVAGVSHESSATRPATRPIPAILDHAVTGLLFSHAELWDQPGIPTPCSFAFVEGRSEVGFGWVGDAKVSVWVDGRPRETGFVTLHDGRGRLGRAWSIPAHHNVQVRISWTSGDPRAGGAEVEASWLADNHAAPGYHAAPTNLVAADPEPEELIPPPDAYEDSARVRSVSTEFAADAESEELIPPPDAYEEFAQVPSAPTQFAADPGPEELIPPPEVHEETVQSVQAMQPVQAAPVEEARPIAAPEETRLIAAVEALIAAVEEAPPIAAVEEAPPIAAVEEAPPVTVVEEAPVLAAVEEVPQATVVEEAPALLAADHGVEPQIEVAASRPAAGFRAWLRRTFGWLTGRRDAVEEMDEDEVWRVAAGLEPASAPVADVAYGTADVAHGTADLVQGTAEVAHGTADVAADQPRDIESLPEHLTPAYDPALEILEVRGLADEFEELIPPAEEQELAATGTDDALPKFEHGGAERVVRIPPTPEPPELTDQAVDWEADDDPRVVDLSRRARPVPFSTFDDLTHVHGDLDLRFDDAESVEPVRETTAPDEPVPVTDELSGEPSGLAPEDAPTAESMRTLPRLTLAERLARAEAATASVLPAPDQADAPTPPPATGASATPQHPAWPTAQELARGRRAPDLRRVWPWVAIVGALFAVGWLVGTVQDDGRPRDATRRDGIGRVLHAMGLGGPRFLAQVNSRPPGAWISVDGEPLNLRTPAAIEVAPGEHTLSLSFTEYGGATFPLRGRKGDRVSLDPTLWGALEITAPDEFGVIAVRVDGVARGVAPVRVDSLTPGVHEVRFSCTGMEPWGQTVEIRVGESHELLARAVQSPSSGVLQVQASLTDETGTQPLRGGQVWIDGELRGITPLILDLPRGPHSIRLTHKGHEAPIQVIDLPGGNQRFAVFELGLDSEVPRLAVDVPARIPRDRPAVLSATMLGIAAREVREMWLHVRMPEGAWRRYAMTLLKAPAGAAGVVTFPTAAFDPQGRSRYYVSAQTRQGDETFTELRTIALEAAAAK